MRKIVTGIIISESFTVNAHVEHREYGNVVVKIDNRFEVVVFRISTGIPPIGTSVDVILIDDYYPSDTKKGQAPIARYLHSEPTVLQRHSQNQAPV